MRVTFLLIAFASLQFICAEAKKETFQKKRRAEDLDLFSFIDSLFSGELWDEVVEQFGDAIEDIILTVEEVIEDVLFDDDEDSDDEDSDDEDSDDEDSDDEASDDEASDDEASDDEDSDDEDSDDEDSTDDESPVPSITTSVMPSAVISESPSVVQSNAPSDYPPCFSSESFVAHSERGLVPLSEIKIGDSVQSHIDGSFSRVYALEKNHYNEATFYQLRSLSGTLLELTDRHMVYLKNRNNPVPAREVRAGDVLESNGVEDTEVIKVNTIKREGHYNPITESGTIVLNGGIVASSFSVARSSPSDFFDAKTEMVHWHTLSHVANAPLRFVCKTLSFSLCSDERLHDYNGLHKFIVLLKSASNLPNWQKFSVFPAIFGTGIFFTILEYFYDQGEAFVDSIASSFAEGGPGAAPDGSFYSVLTFTMAVAALIPPAILLWRKKFLLS